MTQKRTTRTTTVDVAINEVDLTSEEERVLRLRRGIGAPADEKLELKPTFNERAKAALLAIEKEMVRKHEAQARTGAERKKKIVSSLRNRSKR